MATKSISQLDSASTMALGDLLEIAEPNAQSVSGYTSKKISIGSQLAPYIQGTVQNASLNTSDKTLVGAINEVDSDKLEEGDIATGSTFGTFGINGTNKKIYLSADILETVQNADNLTTAGIYYFASGNAPTNIPSFIANGFVIVIETSTTIKQIIMRRGSTNNDYDTYFRTKFVSDNSWSRWHPVIVGEFIGGIEHANNASKAYDVNELISWNGQIYRVTVAIASGGAITNNTNVVRTTISDEIKACRDALGI